MLKQKKVIVITGNIFIAFDHADVEANRPMACTEVVKAVARYY